MKFPPAHQETPEVWPLRVCGIEGEEEGVSTLGGGEVEEHEETGEPEGVLGRKKVNYDNTNETRYILKDQR